VGKLAPTARIALTAAMVDPANPGGLAAFIRTDSPSPMCLVTLAEAAGVAVAGTTVYCGQRNYLRANGIYIHVFLPIPVPVGMRMDRTVYQESAQRYELPVPYPFRPRAWRSAGELGDRAGRRSNAKRFPQPALPRSYETSEPPR
jgi:hypothetical protein